MHGIYSDLNVLYYPAPMPPILCLSIQIRHNRLQMPRLHSPTPYLLSNEEKLDIFETITWHKHSLLLTQFQARGAAS